MDRIRSIVVPTDFSPFSESAAARAVMLATLEGSAIHLVHATRLPLVATSYEGLIPTMVWQDVRRAAEEKLEAFRKELEAKGVADVTAEAADSHDAVRAIADAVEAQRADLVMMGTRGHGGLERSLLGSVTERTLRSLDCPVWVVKEDAAQAAEAIERILVAVDFSPHADRAVEVAAGLAGRLGAAVDVVHAVALPPDYMPYVTPFGVELVQRIQAHAGERLDAVRDRLGAAPASVTTHVRRGRPASVILELAEELRSQLIVMGTRGSTGLAHVLLGSVAERTLRAAHCSVLAVKAPVDG